MEYVKGNPYFCFSEGQIKQYPYLKGNLECEILIVGGGIDGAIANFYLSKNHDVALVDKSRLGYSCTSCATALLEYQLDEFAEDLLNFMSADEIVMAYEMGLQSIEKIKAFIERYGNHCNFALRPTFLFTNSLFSKKDIEKEFCFRKENGFECELYTSENNPFPFEIKNGIYCENGGCEFNPYLFAKQMIENSKNQDKIFENTQISQLEKCEGGGFEAITNFGEKIKCQKVVVATGFNWEVLNRTDLCQRFISYTIVTEPLENFSWQEKALIHDNSSPYHYVRTLPDGRIIFGGADTPFKGEVISEKKANKVYDKLEKDLRKMFPQLANVKIDYKFCGAFGTTDNNLGLIGVSDIDEDLLLFISCGANGIINAMIGAELIDDILSGKENKYEKIFSPKR